MKKSTLTAFSLAACAFAVSQISYASTTAMSGYNCHMVSPSYPWYEIVGSHNNGRLVNTSGGYAYLMCPVVNGASNTGISIDLSAAVTSCGVYTVNGPSGSVTTYSPTSQGPTSGGYYYSFSGIPASTTAFIQCYIANNIGVWSYYAS